MPTSAPTFACPFHRGRALCIRVLQACFRVFRCKRFPAFPKRVDRVAGDWQVDSNQRSTISILCCLDETRVAADRDQTVKDSENEDRDPRYRALHQHRSDSFTTRCTFGVRASRSMNALYRGVFVDTDVEGVEIALARSRLMVESTDSDAVPVIETGEQQQWYRAEDEVGEKGFRSGHQLLLLRIQVYRSR